VKIIRYLASCTLQFWSNLAELFLCIVVNMTCTISHFQDGGSFQLNPLVMTGILIILRTIVTNQIRPYKQIELEYQICNVCSHSMHNTPHPRTNMLRPKHTIMVWTYLTIARHAIICNTTSILYDM